MSKIIDHDTGAVVEEKAAVKREKSTAVGILQTIEHQLKTEIEIFAGLEEKASFRALRIGMLLLRAQTALKRGEFEPWMERNVDVIRRAQAYYFMSLSRTFISRTKLKDDQAYLLCEAQPDLQRNVGGKTGEVVQLVFDFIQDKSLNDLLDEYGIKKRCDRRQGGANALSAWLKQTYPQRRFAPGVTLDQLPMDIVHAWKKRVEQTVGDRAGARGENNVLAWQALANELHRLAIKKQSFRELTREQFDLVYGAVLDAHKTMQAFKSQLF